MANHEKKYMFDIIFNPFNLHKKHYSIVTTIKLYRKLQRGHSDVYWSFLLQLVMH